MRSEEISYVTVDGPFPKQNWEGDEVPEWFVSTYDKDDDELVTFCCNHYDEAICLGGQVAKEHSVEMNNEAMPAYSW